MQFYREKQSKLTFFSQLDASIPRHYLRNLSLPSCTINPNINRSMYTIWRDSWKWIEAQIEQEHSDTSSPASMASCLSEITELKLHVVELKESLQQLHESQSEFRRRFGGLSARSSISSFELDPVPIERDHAMTIVTDS